MNLLSGKTVLVTGATGFIGSHLLKRLQKVSNVKLIALSRNSIVNEDENIKWVCSSLDLLTTDFWEKAGVDNIDIVFHLGAFTPKLGADSNLVDKIYRDNLKGTRSLLDSLPVVPVRIVFASTLDVYSLTGNISINEDSPLGAESLYGASKLFCEKLVKVYANMYETNYSILRYGHIFGPGEEAYRKLIPEMIRKLINNEAPVLFGKGSAERDFLYVEDAVEATLRAAISNIREVGPVNIVRGESITISEIANMLIGITGFSEKSIYLKDKPNGYSLRFDNRLMHELLGQWSFVPLYEGLIREVGHFRGIMDEQ